MATMRSGGRRRLPLFRAIGEAYWMVWHHRGQLVRIIWIWLTIVVTLTLLVLWIDGAGQPAAEQATAQDPEPLPFADYTIGEVAFEVLFLIGGLRRGGCVAPRYSSARATEHACLFRD